MPLRPLPGLAALCLAWLFLPVLLVADLARQGRVPAAAAGLLVVALLAHGLWREGPGRARRPVGLVMAEAGAASLQHADGAHEPVTLCRSSLFLGGGALLVLEGHRRHRFWLTGANLAPATLAALRRQLSQAAVRRPPRSRKFMYWLE